MPEDLPDADLEGQPVHGQAPCSLGHGQVGDVEHDVAGLGRLLAHPQLHVPADHQGRQVVLGGGRRALADDLAAAQHGDGVGDRLDFPELVRDEDDGGAAVPQLADDAEQLLGLGRGEHRRRLVQDQHVRLPDQRLDDLDALLDADRQVLDERVRVDVEAVAVGELARRLGAGLAPVEEAAGADLLDAERDVLRDREHRHQHEVLVHHADAGRDRVLRRAEARRLAVYVYLALVGLGQPVQDVHQGGLPRPVLAEQGVDLPRGNRKADPVVGDEGAEPSW